MTWLARLDGGPLHGGSVLLHGQWWAVALPVGEISEGLAVYGLFRNEYGCVVGKRGELAYEFEATRPYSLAEARLFAQAAPMSVEAVA